MTQNNPPWWPTPNQLTPLPPPGSFHTGVSPAGGGTGEIQGPFLPSAPAASTAMPTLPAGFVVPPGSPPPPNPNDPLYKGMGGTQAYQADYLDWIDIVIGLGGGPPEDPRGGASGAAAAASAANQRMSTYLSAVIEGLGTEIEGRRLRSDQAMQEFQKHLDAISEAGGRFEGIQQYTIPAGSKFVPGFEPGGLATSLGMPTFAASPVSYDPFQIALDMIQNTPSPAAVGAPDMSQIQQAIDLAKSFL